MQKIHLTIQITLDEDKIRENYPDFDILFNSIEEFEEAIYNNITTEDSTLEELGYSVEILKDSYIMKLDISLN